MKQKNKYRYFSTFDGRLIRFNNKTGKGQWFVTGGFPNTEAYSILPIEDFKPEQEVTLSQGLHYMKGNYME